MPHNPEQPDRQDQLMDLARQLNAPVSAPQLWQKIEAELQTAEQVPPLRWHQQPVWRMAAMLVLVLASTFSAWQLYRAQQPAGVLSNQLLAEVADREQAYVEAIARLDSLAQSRLQVLDFELALLYREKLTLLDAQIAQCQSATRENRANAHLRKYMLAALQDKRATLDELLAQPVESTINTKD